MSIGLPLAVLPDGVFSSQRFLVRALAFLSFCSVREVTCCILGGVSTRLMAFRVGISGGVDFSGISRLRFRTDRYVRASTRAALGSLMKRLMRAE